MERKLKKHDQNKKQNTNIQPAPYHVFLKLGVSHSKIFYIKTGIRKYQLKIIFNSFDNFLIIFMMMSV